MLPKLSFVNRMCASSQYKPLPCGSSYSSSVPKHWDKNWPSLLWYSLVVYSWFSLTSSSRLNFKPMQPPKQVHKTEKVRSFNSLSAQFTYMRNEQDQSLLFKSFFHEITCCCWLKTRGQEDIKWKFPRNGDYWPLNWNQPKGNQIWACERYYGS